MRLKQVHVYFGLLAERLKGLKVFAKPANETSMARHVFRIKDAPNNFINITLNETVISRYLTIKQSRAVLMFITICELEIYKGGVYGSCVSVGNFEFYRPVGT